MLIIFRDSVLEDAIKILSKHKSLKDEVDAAEISFFFKFSTVFRIKIIIIIIKIYI